MYVCVSMGEMATGFPAVLTTCSTPFSFPPVLHFTLPGCSTLTTHVVLSALATRVVLNGHIIQSLSSLGFEAPCGVAVGEVGPP